MSALGGGGAKGIKVAGDCIGMGPWEEAQDPHMSPPGCPRAPGRDKLSCPAAAQELLYHQLYPSAENPKLAKKS